MGIFRQFPYTNFHDMNLDWLIKNMRNLLTEWAEYQEKWNVLYDDITTAFDDFKAVFDEHIAQYDLDFQEYINSIDITKELRIVFDQAVADGTVASIINPVIANKTAEWLDANITEPVGVVIDRSLTVDGACADAKAVGDAIQYDCRPFPNAITSAYISQNPNMADLRAWESNYIYTIGGDAYPVLQNKPAEFNSLGTLLKVTGTRRSAGGYASYVLFTTSNTWVGFDNGSRIFWDKISKPTTAFESTITSQYAVDNNMTDLRTWSSNHIYNLGSDVASAVSNFPVGYSGLGTLTKFNGGSNRAPAGYSSYILNSSVGSWFGFDNGSKIIWQKMMNNKSILLIGDSYAEGYSHDGNNDGWALLTENYYDDPNTVFTKSYRGGAGFVNPNNNFESLIISSYFVTDIVVCGGFNDVNYTQQQIEASIDAFVESAKTKCPNAKVHIGCVGWIKQGTGESAYQDWETKRAQIEQTVIPAYQNCIKYGADYLSNVEYWLNDDGLTNTDGYHPSQAGNENIAKAITNGIKTGSAPLPYNETLRI